MKIPFPAYPQQPQRSPQDFTVSTFRLPTKRLAEHVLLFNRVAHALFLWAEGLSPASSLSHMGLTAAQEPGTATLLLDALHATAKKRQFSIAAAACAGAPWPGDRPFPGAQLRGMATSSVNTLHASALKCNINAA